LAAGFGDAVTFGATNWVRERKGTNDVVDKEGAAYFAGDVGGFVAGAALGSATASAIREGSTFATSGAARAVTTKLLNTSAGQALFGSGGALNTGGCCDSVLRPSSGLVCFESRVNKSNGGRERAT
jgi:hypothetical protein